MPSMGCFLATDFPCKNPGSITWPERSVFVSRLARTSARSPFSERCPFEVSINGLALFSFSKMALASLVLKKKFPFEVIPSLKKLSLKSKVPEREHPYPQKSEIGLMGREDETTSIPMRLFPIAPLIQSLPPCLPFFRHSWEISNPSLPAKKREGLRSFQVPESTNLILNSLNMPMYLNSRARPPERLISA